MEIKLEDYLHFYIGCDVITPDGRGKLVGLPWSIVANDRVSVHFGKMVYTKNSIDGGYDKLRNYGEYLIKEQHLVPLKSYHGTDVIHLPGGIKPILRNLSDMTEEELRHCIELKEGGRLRENQPLRRRVKTNSLNEKFTQWYYEDFSGLRKIDETIVANLSNGENGLTLIDTNNYYRCYLKVLPYLIKQGFDLFGLIPAGLAIDKTSLKN